MKTQPHCPQHVAQCSGGTQAETVLRVALASGHHDWGVSPLWV